MLKPKVFFGSSSERLAIAKQIRDKLADACDEAVVWDEGVFNQNSSTLDDLLRAALKFDFAVFVFGPDDVVSSRGRQAFTVRDNVLFEFGLFLGQLGRERTFRVVAQAPAGARGAADEVHVPTDLQGITNLSFNSNATNSDAEAGRVAFRIQEQLNKVGVRRMKGIGRPIDWLGVPTHNGLSLSYSLQQSEPGANGLWPIQLTVERTAARDFPFTGEVLFRMETFEYPQIARVSFERASIVVGASKPFRVRASADEGATILELDLATFEDLCQTFRKSTPTT